MTKDYSERFETLMHIKEKLSIIKENIECAIAYGSAICEDFYCHSDFDILLFLKDCSLSYLDKLKTIKKEMEKEDIKVDFNVHSINEKPELRKECFWHNNRSLYFQKEITLYGIVLIGKSPFLINNFNQFDLKKESICVVNSLLYQSRKLFINRELNQNEKINLMKWCIYATLYSLSSKNIFTKTKTEALEIFNKYYDMDIKPIEFLKAKQENTVNEELIQKAYKFLEQLDIILFEEYNNDRK